MVSMTFGAAGFALELGFVLGDEPELLPGSLHAANSVLPQANTLSAKNVRRDFKVGLEYRVTFILLFFVMHNDFVCD
jgi:hypothetical protein